MIRITKDVLRKLNTAVGKLDSDSSQVFAGFVGRLEIADRLYHGELTFTDAGDDPPKDTVSVAGILSPPSPTKPPKATKQAKPKTEG